MKKLLSMAMVVVLSLSIFAVTASADKVTLLDKHHGDIRMTDTTYVKNLVTDENGFITGRTIDASEITASTSIGTTSNQKFLYATESVKSDGSIAPAASSSRFKNNFTWEFDFTLDKMPATDGDNGSFFIQFGANWQNAVRFSAKSGTVNGEATKKYYICWAGGSDIQDSAEGASAKGISYEKNPYWIGSKYMLEEGKTYRLKFEFDARNSTPVLYATFTNPNITKVGSTVTPLDTPDWNNPDIYTKTTSNPISLGFTCTTLSQIKTASTRLDVAVTAKSAMKMTTSNEKFYIDRFWPVAQGLSVAGNSVTASVNTINITNAAFYTYVPTLLLGVYKDNKLVASGINKYITTIPAITDCTYDVTVSDLPDGTYTVKAFVWNSLDKLQPYPNCLVEQVLTVTDGVGVLTDPVAAE